MLTLEELRKDFLNALDEIEFEHITYFILREAKFKSDTRDCLKNHYIFAAEKSAVVFGFCVESDLPEEIRIKCLANYVHYFPDGYLYDALNRF